MRDATGGRGVDVVLDIVGGDYLPRNIEILAVEGRLVQIGLQGGSSAQLNMAPLLMKRLTITASTLRARSVAEKGALAAAVKANVWPLLESGAVSRNSRDVPAPSRPPTRIGCWSRASTSARSSWSLDFSRRSFVALQHRNFRLIWIGLFLSFTGSTMQNAALLWQVSLLVPPDQKGLALGLVGLVKVVPIVVFSMLGGVVADAWNRRKLMLFTQTGSALVALSLAYADVPRAVERVADLRAGGPQLRRRRVRSAGAARAAADAGAARAPAECDQPQHHHVPDGVGRRARRSAA